MTLLHKSHEAICLCCKFVEVDRGEPGYSSLTPGTDMSIGCMKNHWQFGPDESDGDLHEIMQQAQTCKDYEAKP